MKQVNHSFHYLHLYFFYSDMSKCFPTATKAVNQLGGGVAMFLAVDELLIRPICDLSTPYISPYYTYYYDLTF